MKMNNVYFLTFDDTYHKFEILKCGNALFTKYYPPTLIDVIYIVFTDWHRLVYKINLSTRHILTNSAK